MVKVQFKQLHEDAILPIKGTPESACFDLCSIYDEEFEPGEIRLVRTGWACACPKGWRANIYVRSSTPYKKGFVLANGVGIIDNDYRGELLIQLMNVKSIPHEVETGATRVGKGISFPKHTQTILPVHNKISKGERIAQLEIVEHIGYEIEVVDELSEAQRTGGIGSTGL